MTEIWCPSTNRPCHEAGECEVDGTCKRDPSRRVIMRREYEAAIAAFLLRHDETWLRIRLRGLGLLPQQIDGVLNTRRAA